MHTAGKSLNHGDSRRRGGKSAFGASTAACCRSHKEGDLRTVRAVGKLDIATAPLLEERLRQTFEYHAGPTVLDLTEVSFIDRAGLRVLILAALRSREDRDRLRIRIGTGAVQGMIEATGVASLPLA